MRKLSAPSRRRALVLLDAMGAIALLAILLLAMAGVMTYQHKAMLKLADRRAATRLAEQTLLSLEAGGPAPSAGPVSSTVLALPAPPRTAWVDVAATVGASQVHLTGLVPTRTGGEP